MGRIKELARDFPNYSNALLALLPRFVDLEDVFHGKKLVEDGFYKKGPNKGEPKYREATVIYLYTKDMGSSCSIKHVLPAYYPNREDLNYSNLNQVHHGGEAMEAYETLAALTGNERAELIKNMLKYCCLDTKAMVVLYLKYVELVQ